MSITAYSYYAVNILAFLTAFAHLTRRENSKEAPICSFQSNKLLRVFLVSRSRFGGLGTADIYSPFTFCHHLPLSPRQFPTTLNTRVLFPVQMQMCLFLKAPSAKPPSQELLQFDDVESYSSTNHLNPFVYVFLQCFFTILNSLVT